MREQDLTVADQAEQHFIVDKRSITGVFVAFVGILQFAWCISVASSRYTNGFSFKRQFLSEMGRTTAPASALFNNSVTLLGLCLIVFFANCFRIENSRSFRWSGTLSACGIVGIGLTPLDTHFFEHHLCLLLWLLPMFPMILLSMLAEGTQRYTAATIGLWFMFLTGRYITSAGTRDAPWNQKLVIMTGFLWLALVGMHVIRSGIRQITHRRLIGHDNRTQAYLHRLNTDGMYPQGGRRAGNQYSSLSPDQVYDCPETE